MRKLVVLAVAAAVLSSATAILAQTGLPSVIPVASDWRDIPALAPTVSDPELRARMNAEIVVAITAAGGDQETARRAIAAIVIRYEEASAPQGARTRPGPK